MITLTREEAQQVMDAYNNLDQSRFETIKALENAMLTLRARLALHDMNKAAEENGEEL